MATYYAFCRVSSEEQEDNFSLDVQEKKLTEIWKSMYPEHELEVTRETGSAKAGGNRSVILSIVDRMEAGDVLSIADNNRFSRGLDFSRALWFRVAQKNAIYVEGGKVLDPSNPYDKAMFSIMAVFSELDNEQRVLKSGEGMQAKKDAGEWVMGPTLGYDVHEGNVIINESEKKIVEMIFAMYADGKGIKRIMDNLYGIGAKGKKGADWSPTQVAQVLRNPIYAGYQHPGKRDIYIPLDQSQLIRSEKYAPLIQEELFWKVHELINAPDGRRPKRTEQAIRFSENPYSSLVICYHCRKAQGRTIRFWHSNAGKWTDGVYISPNHMVSCGCKMFTIPRRTVEVMWEYSIQSAFFTVAGVKSLNKTVSKLKESMTNEEAVQNLIERLGQTEQRVNILYEKYLDEELNGNTDLAGRLRLDFLKFTKAKEALVHEIEETKKAVGNENEVLRAAYASFESIMDKFLDTSPNRRQYILTYLEQGYVYRRNYVIRWKHGITSVFHIPENRGPKRTSFIRLRTLVDGRFAGERIIELARPRLDGLSYGKRRFRNSTLHQLMVEYGFKNLFQ